jgi:VIT1/CCC1 family predicted Fe2+/Mn2+ transporter
MTALTTTTTAQPQPDRAERTMGFGLLFAGVRCILQYAILPFVLPLVGLSDSVAVPISLVLNFVAAGSILYSMSRLWKINYRYKLAYTVVGLTALVILAAFTILDVRALTLGS